MPKHKHAGPPVRTREPSRHIPLSYAQQRLWFIDQLEGGTPQYNVPDAFHIRGELDLGVLSQAINTIVERHESLRTRFDAVEGEPVQIIEPATAVEIPLEDLSALPSEVQSERLAESLRQEWYRPFDLRFGPVLRLRLLKFGRLDHFLLRTVHHVAFDGWSQGLFNRELKILYEAFVEKRANPLPPLPVQYADFACWQRQRLVFEAADHALDYWKKQLANTPEQLELAKDGSNRVAQVYAAGKCHAVVPAHVLAGLKKLSLENKATLYMTLLSAFGAVLSRYSGQEDVLVGFPVANRQEVQLERLIGFFVNTLVLRIK